MSGLHLSHADLIKRLRRAQGHLGNVVTMMEAGRPCADLAQQLHAVEKAIAAAKKVLIHDHLDHCLDEVLSSNGRRSADAMAEFREITKYL